MEFHLEVSMKLASLALFQKSLKKILFQNIKFLSNLINANNVLLQYPQKY